MQTPNDPSWMTTLKGAFRQFGYTYLTQEGRAHSKDPVDVTKPSTEYVDRKVAFAAALGWFVGEPIVKGFRGLKVQFGSLLFHTVLAAVFAVGAARVSTAGEAPQWDLFNWFRTAPPAGTWQGAPSVT